MLTFVFYSIFKLQFDQKKGPILLMAAAISAARTVPSLETDLPRVFHFYQRKLMQNEMISYTVRAALITAAISKIGPFF